MDYHADLNVTIDTTLEFDALAAQVFFYTLAVLVSLSILCSILLLYYFACLPQFHQQHYAHHTIIYLLVDAFLINTIDVPILLMYLQNYHRIASLKDPNSFCIFWRIFDYSVYSINLWLIALFSLERYIMIFFKQVLMKSKSRRLCAYYGLVIFVVVFIFVWYIYLIRFYPCVQLESLDFTQIFCGVACYQIEANEIFLNFDWILNALLPVFLTIMFTFLLTSHVIYQKHKIRRHLANQEIWKRTRKMFLQLLPITLLFLVFNMPQIIIGLLSISDTWYAITPYFYASCLAYCLPICMPFAILSKQKTIQKRLLILFTRQRINTVTPIAMNDLQMRLER